MSKNTTHIKSFGPRDCHTSLHSVRNDATIHVIARRLRRRGNLLLATTHPIKNNEQSHIVGYCE